MENLKEFKLGELFCGPGGLAYGAVEARIEDPDYRIVHAWATDYDQATCETYIRNICPDDPSSVVCEDVHFLDIQKLGPIDALAFGFPSIQNTGKTKVVILVSINNNKIIPVFVYGTLMKNRSASHYMNGADFLGEAALPGFALYDLGWYPGILRREGSTVHGEVYLVSEEMLKAMDGYEGEGFLYARQTAGISGINGYPEAKVYVYLRPVDEAQRIPGGRWNR